VRRIGLSGSAVECGPIAVSHPGLAEILQIELATDPQGLPDAASQAPRPDRRNQASYRSSSASSRPSRREWCCCRPRTGARFSRPASSSRARSPQGRGPEPRFSSRPPRWRYNARVADSGQRAEPTAACPNGASLGG
jgi:hypothetical protein